MRTCSVDGCPRRHLARGYCKSHYNQWHAGRPLSPGGTFTGRHIAHGAATLEEYFWLRVEKTDECWLWLSVKDANGYGVVKFRGAQTKAHRLSLELHSGPLSGDHVVDHLCHNKSCVNPAHLRATNHTVNMQNRKGANSNSTSGVRGVYWDPQDQKWVAAVKYNKRRWRQRFSTLAEAAEAVEAKRRELHAPSLT